MVAVIGVPDERMGEVGKAFVVLRPGMTIDATSLHGWSRANMANYKVPRHWAFLEELPRNSAGKVAKLDLR
jgi:acyl-CoA synthetase (AMP-forming)/AMP-acid ligase II